MSNAGGLGPEAAQALQCLALDCRTRVIPAPSWQDVVRDTVQLRVASGYFEAATAAGLLTDEVSLASADQWPADVSAALEHLGRLDAYSPTTLRGLFTHLTRAQTNGLINSVKGATLELHVVDRINHGDTLDLPGTPDHAVLAHDLNQPGWDVETFQQGHHVGYLQMKESAHPGLLAEHLERYPQYPDVATSHEAVAAARARGMDVSHFHAVTNDAAVTHHVQGALGHLTAAHAAHEAIPEFALAAILVAGVLRLRAGQQPQEAGRWVAEQAATAGVANLAGLAVQVATGTVILRPVAAIGTRFAVARARTGWVALKHLGALRQQLGGVRKAARERGYTSWVPADLAGSN